MYAPAVDQDIPEIVALINRAYRGDLASSLSAAQAYLTGDRTTISLLREDVARRPSAFLLKWLDRAEDAIIGCVWLDPLDHSTWYLGSLAIDPWKQNGGLGRIMLQAAEDWARDRGAERIRLSVVNVREALIDWYLRRGYHRNGKIEPFPYGDDRFGKPLRNDLCFVVLEKRL